MRGGGADAEGRPRALASRPRLIYRADPGGERTGTLVGLGMRRWWYTAVATFVCAMIATVFVGPLQATAVGAPERGFLAAALTLALFFGPLVLVIVVTTSAVAVALRFAVSRVNARAADTPTARFLVGLLPVGALVAFPANAFGDILGLAAAWCVSGGVGALAVGTSEEGRARLSWRVVVLGSVVAVVAGYVMAFAQARVLAG